jgi:hypothetical protein
MRFYSPLKNIASDNQPIFTFKSRSRTYGFVTYFSSTFFVLLTINAFEKIDIKDL